MTNDQETNQARNLLENFNTLDEPVKDKLLTAVKSLAFLYNLADEKGDGGGEHVQPAS